MGFGDEFSDVGKVMRRDPAGDEIELRIFERQGFGIGMRSVDIEAAKSRNESVCRRRLLECFSYSHNEFSR